MVVVIDHGGGLQTGYAHLARIPMRMGTAVAAGALIGRVGATGNATGPHLHFEARVRGADVDPAPALR
jgi:murein DD-endopeptidase MepM/ murein hydrolase activator NlpD